MICSSFSLSRSQFEMELSISPRVLLAKLLAKLQTIFHIAKGKHQKKEIIFLKSFLVA